MTVHRSLSTLLLTSTMLAALPTLALAQSATPPADSGSETEVIVSAQKRNEKLQNVPISIQVLSTKKLDQLNIASFTDYAAMLPSVSFQSPQPGTTKVYIRGVASGGDGNHSGPLPSVGIYLDEQPVTTIDGALDVHVYDIARIESLAGPQGTLYGASSEAGTLRIITNKPDHSGYYGRVDADINQVSHGGVGGKLEGMVNVPINDKVAARFVGWSEHQAGYIDNVAGTRSFLGGLTVNNAGYVKKNYNTVDIAGGRAALKVDLDDNWTVTGTLIGQDQKNKGNFGYDPKVGDLKVQHFLPESYHDRFAQAALTVQGKIGNFDLTYAGAYMDRKVDASADYTDYAEAYDQLYSSVGGVAGYFYFSNNAGKAISSQQVIVGKDHFTKQSHELRIATPQNERLRFVGGLFVQRQTHLIHQDYQVAGLADALSVNGHPGTLWLTQQMRIDRDSAIFGELSYDITPTLTVTAGGRAFDYDNSLIGFFGFGKNPDPNGPPNAAGASTGARRCFTTGSVGIANPKDAPGTWIPAAVAGSPCTDLGVQNADGSVSPKHAKGNGFSPKVNLTWKISPDYMVYVTGSRGFRPGGINRRASVAPYAPDYLTNYELGFKTTLFNKTLRLNGAIYDQQWDKFQFAYLGANSFTEVHNGPNASIKGLELDATWQPIKALVVTASGAFTDAKTLKNLCYKDDPTYSCKDIGDGNFISAPKGIHLPITPQVKLAASARYTWEMGPYTPYWQVVVTHQSKASSDIRTATVETGTGDIVNPAALLGDLKAFSNVDLSFGAERGVLTAEVYVSNLFDERGQLSRYMECGSCYQRPYIVTNTPRTYGVRLGSKF